MTLLTLLSGIAVAVLLALLISIAGAAWIEEGTWSDLTLLRDSAVAVLLALLISIAGAAWIDFDVPEAWPDLIGPSDTGSGSSIAPQHN